MKKTVVQILLTGNAGITVECRDKSGNAINGSGNADLDWADREMQSLTKQFELHS